MTMITNIELIPAGRFKAQCLQIMDRVAKSGRPVVVTKRGKPVAQLGPVVRRPGKLVGFWKGRIEIAGDLVEPLGIDWAPR